MSRIALLFCACIGLHPEASQSHEDVSPEQFARLLKSCYDPIKSLAFIHEGETQYIGAASDRSAGLKINGRFQGTYIYKRRNLVYHDLYFQPIDPHRPMLHITRALRGSTLEEVRAAPDWPGSDNRLATSPGGALSFNGPNSPEHLLLLGQVLEMLDDPRAFGYEFQGWESIDGHNCLRVKLDLAWHSGSDTKDFRIFWFDLDRGGHAVRVEHYIGPNLLVRIDGMQFARVPSRDGTLHWIPIRSEFTSFLGKGGSFSTEPLIRETHELVRGTALINEDFPDTLFTASRRAGLPRNRELEKLNREYQRMQIASDYNRKPKPPLSRNDPAAVEQRLSRLLVDADRRATMILAASSSRSIWNWPTLMQIALIGLGIVTLVGVAVYRRKYA
jgi:hypothetical protein